jgi:hypothetical protein
MTDHAVQLQLPRPPMELDETIIARPKDLLRAFVMQADLGGLDDKQAAAAAGMDPATFSRFKQGDVGIKPLNLLAYGEQCGNHLALANWAYRCGYALTVRESELEKRLRRKDEELLRERAENALLRGLITRSA